jgi:tight adherence protein C
MNVVLIIALGAVALFSASGLAVLIALGGHSPVQARLAKLATVPGMERPHPGWRNLMSGFAAALAMVRRPLRLTADEDLVYRLSLGGYRQPEDADTFLNAKVLCAVLGVLAATFAGRGNLLVFLFILGALGYFAPDLFLIRAIGNRKTRIGLSLPNALDLLVVCMEAGLGMDQAVLRVGAELRISSPALSQELMILSREQRAGKPRLEAWRSMADRVDLDSVRQFSGMLTQSERLGTPIARALAEFSDNLRTKRLYQAEERAAKTTVKLIFPLVLFILPAMFVVILGPAALDLVKVFDEMSP